MKGQVPQSTKDKTSVKKLNFTITNRNTETKENSAQHITLK